MILRMEATRVIHTSRMPVARPKKFRIRLQEIFRETYRNGGRKEGKDDFRNFICAPKILDSKSTPQGAVGWLGKDEKSTPSLRRLLLFSLTSREQIVGVYIFPAGQRKTVKDNVLREFVC